MNVYEGKEILDLKCPIIFAKLDPSSAEKRLQPLCAFLFFPGWMRDNCYCGCLLFALW